MKPILKSVVRGWPAFVATAALAAPALAGTNASQSCGAMPFARQSDDGAFQIEARDASCQQARSVAGASRPSRFRVGHPRYTALGFACTGQDEQLGGQGKYVVSFRCVRGHSAVSFVRG